MIIDPSLNPRSSSGCYGLYKVSNDFAVRKSMKHYSLIIQCTGQSKDTLNLYQDS